MHGSESNKRPIIGKNSAALVRIQRHTIFPVITEVFPLRHNQNCAGRDNDSDISREKAGLANITGRQCYTLLEMIMKKCGCGSKSWKEINEHSEAV